MATGDWTKAGIGLLALLATLTAAGITSSAAAADSPPPATVAANTAPTGFPELQALFETVCMATGADPTAATAKAQDLGYARSKGLWIFSRSGLLPNLNLKSQLGIETGSAHAQVLLGDGPVLQRGRFPTRVCAVAASHFENADIRAAYRAGPEGREPDIKETNYDVYFFTLSDGVRKLIAVHDDKAMIQAMQDGVLRAVQDGTKSDDHGTKFDFMLVMIPFDPKAKTSVMAAH